MKSWAGIEKMSVKAEHYRYTDCNFQLHFNYNGLIPGDMNDDIYILKENITDEEGMQNDRPCCKSS